MRVNCLAPGYIAVPMSPSMRAVSGGEEALIPTVPLRRLGTVDEMAEIVEFLLSDRASYITGARPSSPTAASPRCERAGGGQRGDAAPALRVGPAAGRRAPGRRGGARLRGDLVLTSGAPLPFADYVGGQREAIIGAALFEGLAADRDEAIARLESGAIRVDGCHDYGCVGSLAGVYTASMPVFVVHDEAPATPRSATSTRARNGAG